MSLSNEQINTIYARIDNAIKYQEQVWKLDSSDDLYQTGLTKPQKWLSLVEGTYWNKLNALSKEGRIIRRSSNHILPKLRVKQDIITQGKTEFIVEPSSQEFYELSTELQPLINSEWYSLEVDEVLNKIRWDSDIYGYGVIEMGWKYEQQGVIREGEMADPVVDANTLAGLRTMAGQPMPDENTPDGQELNAQYQREDIATMWQTVSDDPYIERISPELFLADPNTSSYNLHDARYAFKIRYEYTSRIKSNDNYINTDELTGDIYANGFDKENNIIAHINQGQRDDQAISKLYDGYFYFDADGDGIEEFLHIVIAEENRTLLLIEESHYEFSKGSINPFPYRIMPGIITNNDSFYCRSAVEQAEPLQIAYDEAFNQLNEMRRKSARIYLYPEGQIKPETIRKFEQGKDLSMIGVEPNVLESIRTLEYPRVPESIYTQMQLLPTEIGRALGVSDFQESVQPQREMLATEVIAIQNQGSSRMNGDMERFNRFKEDIAICIIVLIQQFAHQPRSYMQDDEYGNTKSGSLSLFDIRGKDSFGEVNDVNINYKIRLSPQNIGAKNKEIAKQEALMLLNTLAPFTQQPDSDNPLVPLIQIKPLLKQILKSFDFDNPKSVIQSKPTPEEMEKIQMQIQNNQKMQMEQQMQMQNQQIQMQSQADIMHQQVKNQGNLDKEQLKQQGKNQNTLLKSKLDANGSDNNRLNKSVADFRRA